jgi:hypothetical protein
MAQLGPSDYRSPDRTGEFSGGVSEELGAAIKERPYTTMAIAASLAFVVGALWQLGRRRPESHRLPEFASWDGVLPRRWR